MTNPESPQELDTRQRLLETATRLFAERGFKHVSVREICSAAGGANVAAINYYFRDKAGLYRELLESRLTLWVEERERHAESLRGKPSDEQLYLFIRWFLGNILIEHDDEQDVLFAKMLNWEMVDPTPEFRTIFEKGMAPNFQRLLTIVSEIAGLPKAHPAAIQCTMSTMGTCLTYGNAKRMREYFTPKGFEFTPVVIDAIARQITQFCLAGIRAVGEAAQKESGNRESPPSCPM